MLAGPAENEPLAWIRQAQKVKAWAHIKAHLVQSEIIMDHNLSFKANFRTKDMNSNNGYVCHLCIQEN